MVIFDIPKYAELSVKSVWPKVKENPILLSYFPTLKDTQLPEREFMYGVIGTLMPEELRSLVAASAKSRSFGNEEEKQEFVEIHPDYLEDIKGLFSMKSKLFQHTCDIFYLATKGRANFLLKKSTVFNPNRKEPKKFPADLTMIEGFGEGRGAEDMEEQD